MNNPGLIRIGPYEELQFATERQQNHPKQSPIFSLLRNYKQTVPVAHHIAALPTSTYTGFKQLSSIPFKDLNLGDIEELFKDEEQPKNVNLFPLRNFFIGKKRGKDSCKSVFRVVPKTEGSKVCYYVKIDNDFVTKTCKTLKSPKIQINLKIEGINRSIGERKSKELPLEWTQYNIDPSGFELNNFLSSNRPYFVIQLKPLITPRFSNFCETGITKEALAHQSTSPFKNLAFIWKVSIQFEDEPLSIQGGCFRQDLASTLESLYNLDDSTKDVAIVANNKEEIKCHGVILMANIPLFRSMLLKIGMVEGETGRIEMLGTSADGLTQFIKFLYGFPINPEELTPELAVELLQLSNKYGLNTLEKDLTEFLTSKTVEWFTLDALMELYFIAHNVDSLEELRAHSLTEMSGLTKETMTGCEYFKKLSKQDALSLLFKLLEWR